METLNLNMVFLCVLFSNVQLKKIRNLWLYFDVYDYKSRHLWSYLYKNAISVEKWPQYRMHELQALINIEQKA